MTGEWELSPEETYLAYVAMRELRPQITSVEDFVTQINGAQRKEGYRLVASFADPDPGVLPGAADPSGAAVAAGLLAPAVPADLPAGPPAVAAAGFRRLHTLAWGDLVYVDDLVTMEAHRGRGHAHRLLDWILAEARRLGCAAVHLDSAPHRHAAHRLYMGEGFVISSFHFSRDA